MKLIFTIFKIILSKFISLVNFNKGIKKRIGSFPNDFLFDPYFIFSNFSSFGERHNNGFEKLLELAIGKRTIFDIGSHIGLTCMPLSKVIIPEGKIYAFEPSQTNIKYLNKHINLNRLKNIEIVPQIVGSNNSEIVFYESPFVSAMNSIIPYRKIFLAKSKWKSQISLDYFCQSRNIIPEIIKIDVEGSEFLVLQGAEKIINQYKPIIVLSVHPKHLEQNGTNISSLLDYLVSLNYSIKDMLGNDIRNLQFTEYILTPKH